MTVALPKLGTADVAEVLGRRTEGSSGNRACGSRLTLVQDRRLNEYFQPIISQVAKRVAERLMASRFGRAKAVVLTGSFARGEGSVLQVGDRLRVLGDMEFMVFCVEGARVQEMERDLAEQALDTNAWLAGLGIDCEVEFSVVSPKYLRSLQPHIFGYELLVNGRVLWGASDVLQDSARFSAASIPRWDAWRMLNNRILEQLLWMEALQHTNRALLEKIYYHILKCYMDIGTSLLIFGGRYQPTYASRAAELQQWAICERKMTVLPLIAARVAACTTFKLFPNCPRPPLGVCLNEKTGELRTKVEMAFTELVSVVHSVWRWEAARLAKQPSSCSAADRILSDEVLRTQPRLEKLRGWAKLSLTPAVLRQRGFSGRMARLLGRGSPRYLIYSVGSQLYFESPVVLAGTTPNLGTLESLLPVAFEEHANENRDWWRMRANALLGWKLFLRNHWA